MVVFLTGESHTRIQTEWADYVEDSFQCKCVSWAFLWSPAVFPQPSSSQPGVSSVCDSLACPLCVTAFSVVCVTAFSVCALHVVMTSQ